MKIHPPSAALHLLLSLHILPLVLSDLNSDRNALMEFASSVSHLRKLNWNSTSPVCSSWAGILCDSNQTRVIGLHLSRRGLLGPIPPNIIRKLDALRIINLHSNILGGNIPHDIFTIPSLHSVYLQNNCFSGNIPPIFSPKLLVLDLSFNSLIGKFPPMIQNLTLLTRLSLQNNFFSGPIPDLKLPNLRLLNLSYNMFNGTIPSSLQKFPGSSFTGNSLLCGSPLTHCAMISPSPSPSPARIAPTEYTHRRGKAPIVSSIVGGSVLLCLLVLMAIICCWKRGGKKGSGEFKAQACVGVGNNAQSKDFESGVQGGEKNELVFFEGMASTFNLEDLLRASAEVIGKGSYGTAYKASLEDGTDVVVKRVREFEVGKKEFEEQMVIVGRIKQHKNVVPLRAYFYSKDEKLLVYDHMSAGSLAAHLHGNKETGTTPLDWDSRLKIAKGTARGIAHIHSEGGIRFTHGNIKSSNVLLTLEFDGCISDFGLTPLLDFQTAAYRNVGYLAPDLIQNQKITQKSDVYSFGVVLLELLTGKAPLLSQKYNFVIDLPKWVQSVVREEWTGEVFDEELKKYQNAEEEMVRMLQIALVCVNKLADLRPAMDGVVKMIEEIRPARDNP